MSVNFIVNNLPRISFREYTIASSSNDEQNQMVLCLKLVDDVSVDRRNRIITASEGAAPASNALKTARGLVSGYLFKLQATITDNHSAFVTAMIKPSAFHQFFQNLNSPDDYTKYNVLVVVNGAGTSLLRALICHEMNNKKSKISDIKAFCGFTNEDNILFKDIIFDEQKKKSFPFRFDVKFALSRVTAKRIYVQRLMQEDKKQLKLYLTEKENEHSKSVVLICGGNEMVVGVKLALNQILGFRGFKTLEQENRYFAESFG